MFTWFFTLAHSLRGSRRAFRGRYELPVVAGSDVRNPTPTPTPPSTSEIPSLNFGTLPGTRIRSS